MGAFGGWGKAKFASQFSNGGGLGIIAALNFPDPHDFKENLKFINAPPYLFSHFDLSFLLARCVKNIEQ